MKEGGMFMTNEKFIGFTMEKTKHIALVAHDGKKKELVEWCDKNKEILKQAGVMSFMYLILCLGGAYESYYRGADLKLTARIAGCVLLLMWGGIFIFIIKKEYDSRKYLGYIYLLISLELMLQTVIQGNIPVESRVKMCIAGYVATLVV